MATICTGGGFPSYSGIAASVCSLMPSTPIDFPGFDLVLPTMPTMPSIPWPSMPSLDAQIEMFAGQLQSFQLMTAVSAMFDVLSPIFSLPWPAIPGLPGISFPDLMALNPAALVASLKAMVQLPSINGLIPDFNFSFLPHVPSPLFPTLRMPDMEVLLALQMTASAYLSNLATMLFTMANEVADIFEVSKLPALPAFPSLASIMAMLPPIPPLPDFSIPDLVFPRPVLPTLADLKGLAFGAFGGFQLSMPDPLIPSFSIPEYDFTQGLTALYSSLNSINLKTIADFIPDTLGLSLPIPELCLPINLPQLPALPDLPNPPLPI